MFGEYFVHPQAVSYRRHGAAIAGALLVLLGLLALSYFLYERHELSVFSNALRDAHTREDVSVNGTPFRVENGVVSTNGVLVNGRQALAPLRIAYAKVLARRAPLMAIAGTDPDTILATVAGLKKATDALAELQSTTTNAALVRSSLYPLSFLTALAHLERARIAFLSAGSDADEAQYEIAQRDAAFAYEADMKRHEDAFERIVPADSREFVQATAVITRGGMLDAMHTLLAGVTRTKREMLERTLCIKGLVFVCHAGDIMHVALPQPKPYDVTPETIQKSQDIREIYAEARDDPQIRSLQPLLISSSVCAAYIPSAPVFIFKTSRADVAPGLPLAMYVGDIQFMAADRFRAVAFYDYFAEHGIRYLPVSPLTVYMCSANGRDVGTMHAVQAVSVFSRSAKLHTYATGDTQKRISQLESALSASSPMITESDAVAYLNEAARLADAGALPEESANAIDDLRLAYTNASAGYDAAIEEVINAEDVNFYLRARDIPVENSAAYLFFFRSSLELLFLGDNPSTTGKTGNLFEPYDGTKPFEYYSTLSQTAAMKPLLLHDIRTYLRAHTPPLAVPTPDILSGR